MIKSIILGILYGIFGGNEPVEPQETPIEIVEEQEFKPLINIKDEIQCSLVKGKKDNEVIADVTNNSKYDLSAFKVIFDYDSSNGVKQNYVRYLSGIKGNGCKPEEDMIPTFNFNNMIMSKIEVVFKDESNKEHQYIYDIKEDTTTEEKWFTNKNTPEDIEMDNDRMNEFDRVWKESNCGLK